MALNIDAPIENTGKNQLELALVSIHTHLSFFVYDDSIQKANHFLISFLFCKISQFVPSFGRLVLAVKLAK